MNCKDIMNVLSQCGLGALLLKNHRILEINESGDRLLLGDGTLVGKILPKLPPNFASPSNLPVMIGLLSASIFHAARHHPSMIFHLVPN